MKNLMSKKQAKIMSLILIVSFLAIHILMLVFFSIYGVKPMVIFNVFSVLFYAAMPYVIKREWFRVFAIGTYFEVVLHMTMASFYAGFSAGFSITLIGMSILLHYSEYVGRYLHVPYVKATFVCVIGMAAYLFACVIDYARPAPYPLPTYAAFALHLFWGVITFSITLFFLYIFVKLTAGSEELLSREVGHDQLTGLPNRYFVADTLGELVDNDGLLGYWVAMMDIDDFKAINDTYGHNCGDYILRELAQMTQKRWLDMKVCRWGGEEFLMFGKLERNITLCCDMLDALRLAIMKREFEYEGKVIHVTVTIGVAEYKSGSSLREWIAMADERLYEGKNNGKNQVVV